MEKGKKFDSEKPDLSLLSSIATIKDAEVMTDGKKKYGGHNWRGGIKWSRVYAAVQRHLLAWNGGETYDKETGRNHLAHARCGLMFLLEYSETHPGLDDRYEPVVTVKDGFADLRKEKREDDLVIKTSSGVTAEKLKDPFYEISFPLDDGHCCLGLCSECLGQLEMKHSCI